LSGRESTGRVFARYLAFQIPGTFVAAVVLTMLHYWEFISRDVGLLLFGLYVLKDLLLFPVTRVGYEQGGGPHGASALLGNLAEAQEDLLPGQVGWVRIGPERWRALLVEGSEETVARGAKARVVAVDDLILRVESTGA